MRASSRRRGNSSRLNADQYRFERLEPRRLLSAGPMPAELVTDEAAYPRAVVHADGVLEVRGTDATTGDQWFVDWITIHYQWNEITVDINFGQVHEVFDLSNINLLDVQTLAGNDYVALSGGLPGGTVDLGEGDDIIALDDGVITPLAINAGDGVDSMSVTESWNMGSAGVHFDGGPAPEPSGINQSLGYVGTPLADEITVADTWIGLNNDPYITFANVNSLTARGAEGDDHIQITTTRPLMDVSGDVGNDTLVGGPGPEYLRGDKGDDVYYLQDGMKDTVLYEEFETSVDTAFADDVDQLAGIEHVNPGAVVSGTVFDDSDSDGLFDSDDVGIAGWVMFVDENENGFKDAGETYTTTDPDGNYVLAGPFSGTIKVGPQLQQGWRRTLPGTSFYTVDTSTSYTSNLDFGFTQHVAISGAVFNDADKDGLWNGEESGVSGQTVFIDSNDNGVVDLDEPQTGTDPNGVFHFKTLAAGTHVVRVSPPAHWQFTEPSNGRAVFTLGAGAGIWTTFGIVAPSEIILDNTCALPIGAWATSSKVSGFHGANYLHDGNTGKGSKSVEWQFTNRPADGWYAVYTRWTSGADRASDVRYEVGDDQAASGSTRLRVKKDQRTGGGTWQLLGTFRNPAYVNVVNYGSNGYVIADAVKFVLMPPPAPVQAPTGVSAAPISSTSAQLSWNDNSISETGYIIWRRNVDINGAFFGIHHVYADTTSFVDTTAVAGTRYEYRVSPWNQSGDHPSSNVVAVTMPSTQPPGADEVIVDNTSASLTGTWSSSNRTAGFYGSNYLHDSNTGKGAKSALFTPAIGTTGKYAVYVRWISGADRASNVPYDVTHAGGITTVTKDQRTGGGIWQMLGNFDFSAGTSGSVRIRTSGTGGYVIADAARFVRVAAATTEVIADNSTATLSGTWFTSTGKPGYYGANYLHDGNTNTGNSTITWNATLPTAGTYRLFARWIAGPDRAATVGYNVFHADGTSSVYVDQRTQGGTWVQLGEFTFLTAASVKLMNIGYGSGGYVTADAVRWVKV